MKGAENSNYRKFGLVGREISHSFSPKFFKNKFEKENIQASYRLFELKHIRDFPNLFAKHDIAGLNVTIPYKEEIIIFLDELSPQAAEIGAVNTIKIKGAHLFGYNTDWIGFKNSIQPLLNSGHNQALILGTGGATKAVQYALKQLEIPFNTVSRQAGRGDFIYSDLNEKIISEHKIIINSSPVGSFPHIVSEPQIPYEFLDSSHLVYDLVYNPEKTKFLQLAEMKGAKIKNGLEMLEIQAEEAWKIWNSK
ncbi:MAG: shikimate dehydrogenase [Flavobacteriaceae bacterium]|nr:shikimate dehydrogenase [Flavobacteriaceae bacterium]